MADELSPDQEFLMWIGVCITAWAGVEEHLFEICATVLGGPKVNAAIVYYRTPTLDARLNLTHELVLARLPKKDPPNGGHDHPHVKTWNELRNDIKGLLRVRGRIAHHPVHSHPNILEVESIFEIADLLESSWLEIYMSAGEQLRPNSAAAEPLLIGDLKDHHEAVIGVWRRLETFGRSLPGRPE